MFIDVILVNVDKLILNFLSRLLKFSKKLELLVCQFEDRQSFIRVTNKRINDW